MVTIITGPINSGKTTKMEDIFENDREGDGFISLKLIENDVVEGFDVMKISSKETKPFIRRRGKKLPEWKENCFLGPYTVSEEALKWVTEYIERLINNEIFPIYLDEIGVLEIKGKCFYKILGEMLKAEGKIYISTRDENLDAVISKFGITGAKIIKTGARYA
ncbi:MAG: hypothetical protein J7L77_04860 [Clostridiales bacterium]|nr:hypothetical protein [Clostridiales bacterium]